MRCNKAPDGWTCTRLDGHAGPCAAERVNLPTGIDRLLDTATKPLHAEIERLRAEATAEQNADAIRRLADNIVSQEVFIEQLRAENERLKAGQRAAWEAGIKLARSYGDNLVHLEGDQKQRHWDSYQRGQKIKPLPEAPST